MKFPKTLHFPFSPGTTSDDRISTDYSFLENEEIVITEKMDGQNTGTNRGGQYARSHAVYTEHPWARECWDIHARIGHQLAENIMIFGENMEGIHSIKYDRLKSYLYIFGITEGEYFLSWDDTEMYANILEIPTVPVLFRGRTNDLKNLVEELVNQPSTLGSNRKIDNTAKWENNSKPSNMEGVVVRLASSYKSDQESFSKAVLKWVCKKHVSTGTHWTRTWEKARLYYNDIV